jgi:hypothetical protein
MRRLLLSLFIGLIIGAIIGLIFGWGLSPVEMVQSPMSNLRSNFKDEYTIMIADAFQVDRDINEAIRRLQPLGCSNIPICVREVTERYISQSGPGREADIRTLVVLSRALGYYTPPMQAFIVLPTVAPTPRP